MDGVKKRCGHRTGGRKHGDAKPQRPPDGVTIWGPPRKIRFSGLVKAKESSLG